MPRMLCSNQHCISLVNGYYAMNATQLLEESGNDLVESMYEKKFVFIEVVVICNKMALISQAFIPLFHKFMIY